MSHNRNWPEDFSDDNGQYMNRCSLCGNNFVGRKNRVVCRECADPDRKGRQQAISWSIFFIGLAVGGMVYSAWLVWHAVIRIIG